MALNDMTLNTAELAGTTLLVGGYTDLGSDPVTEVLNTEHCAADIETVTRVSPVSVSTEDGELHLVCGGDPESGRSDTTSRTCDKFDPETKTFTHHSQLLQRRFGSSALSTSLGVIIVGGAYSQNTIEFLATHSTNWEARNDIPGYGVWLSCMAMVNSTHAIVVGGLLSPTSVRLYDVTTDLWTDLPSLSVGVWGHDCVNTEQGVLVTGGITGGSVTGRSVLIDPRTGQVETVGSLNVARAGHKLTRVGEKWVAIGGFNVSVRTTSIEEWVPGDKSWVRSSLSLDVARSDFGVLTVPVPASVLCN